MASTGGHEWSEFRSDWGVVLASFAGLAFGVATLAVSYTIGVFIEPLSREFGWSRAQILTAGTIVSVAVAALSLVVGWLTDRYSIRRLVIASQLGFGLMFFVLGAFLSNLWNFYLFYFLMAALGAATIAVPFAKLITAKFVRRRGLALGLAMAGSGLCGLVVPAYAAFVVETFGWRAGYFAIGLLPLLVALPLSVFFVHDLPDEDRKPAAADVPAPEAPRGLVGGDLTLPAALGGYRFWVLFAIFLIGSCVMTALITNFVPILADQGYPATQAAAMAGSFGLAVIAGRIVVGYLIDRFWAPVVGFLLFVPAAAAIALLAGGELSATGLVATIFISGFAAGAEVDLMGYLVSRYFGLRHFGKLFAGIYVGFALGPGVTTPLFGASRDQLGSYSFGLYVAAGALTVAAAMFLVLGRYPKMEEPAE